MFPMSPLCLQRTAEGELQSQHDREKTGGIGSLKQDKATLSQVESWGNCEFSFLISWTQVSLELIFGNRFFFIQKGKRKTKSMMVWLSTIQAQLTRAKVCWLDHRDFTQWCCGWYNWLLECYPRLLWRDHVITYMVLCEKKFQLRSQYNFQIWNVALMNIFFFKEVHNFIQGQRYFIIKSIVYNNNCLEPD